MNEIRDKIVEGLKNSQWDKELSHYWESDRFLHTLTQLHQYTLEKKRFTPGLKDAFRFLKECPFSTVKVVIFIDDNCNTLLNMGIPFSQDFNKMPIVEFSEGLKRECKRSDVKTFLKKVIEREKKAFDYSLLEWCKQGVLIIPYALTTRVDGNPHYDLWSEFRARIVDTVNTSFPDIPWVLVNTRTIKMESYISSKNVITFKPFDYTNQPDWSMLVNNILKAKKEKPIKWA